jgi:hypothetical protein
VPPYRNADYGLLATNEHVGTEGHRTAKSAPSTFVTIVDWLPASLASHTAVPAALIRLRKGKSVDEQMRVD